MNPFSLPLDLLFIVLFIVPGYIVLYFISIYRDYIPANNQLDRVIEYLVFSFVSYLFSILLLFCFFGIFSLLQFFGVVQYIHFQGKTFNGFLNSYWVLLTVISIIFAPFIGYLLGTKFFGKGYPHKFFNTHKKFTPSIFSELFTDKLQEGGGWVTCHMKDNTIFQGMLSDYDKDEDKRDYVLVLENVKKIYLDTDYTSELHSNKVLINVREVNAIEFTYEEKKPL